MALAILLASTLTHPVSSADSLSARSVLHRRDGRNDRSRIVDISQRLGRDLNGWSFRFRSWRGLAVLAADGAPYLRPSPCCRSRCNMYWRTAQIEGRLTIGLGLHALDAGLLLLIAAGLAVGLFD